MSEPATTDKQRMIQLLEGQPDDSSFEELIKELAFDRMVERLSLIHISEPTRPY